MFECSSNVGGDWNVRQLTNSLFIRIEEINAFSTQYNATKGIKNPLHDR